ncbi:MAG: Ig-like domain-containing protein, partial [Bifidobacteriaceae bacterium]|nr:Ig-like domain-containing protein [Bifidobacteriaceae bacterium]
MRDEYSKIKKRIRVLSLSAGFLIIGVIAVLSFSYYISQESGLNSVATKIDGEKLELVKDDTNNLANNNSSSDGSSKEKELTFEEKQKLYEAGVGSLDDGSRSIIVTLKDISLEDLLQANPGITSERIEATFSKNNSNGALITDEYKKAIIAKQDKLIAEIKNLGKITVEYKYQATPEIVFAVDHQGKRAIESNQLVKSVEDDRIVFPTVDSETLNPNPIEVMGGSAANGFVYGGKQYNGSNYAVAVLDTGVEKDHPNLAGKVVAEACFSYVNSSAGASSTCPGSTKTSTGVDIVIGSGAAAPCTAESCFHGTHVASEAALAYQDIIHNYDVRGGETMTGKNVFQKNLASLASEGKGISGGARDASIVAVQVFSYTNSGIGAYNSAYGAAMDWIATNSDNRSVLPKPVAAVNLSLGSGGYSKDYETCVYNYSLSSTIGTLKNKNIAVVAATGNSWKDGITNAVSMPACINGVIAIGASKNSGDEFASYSQNGDATDLVAVGGDKELFYNSNGAFTCTSGSTTVPCSISNNSYVWGAQSGGRGDYAFWGNNGTSMASPYAAGIFTSLRSYDTTSTSSTIANVMAITGKKLADTRSGATTSPKPLIQGNAALLALSNTGYWNMPSISNFKPSPVPSSVGSETTLSAKVSPGSSCAIDGKIGVVNVDSNGNISVPKVLSQDNYTLTCINSDGDYTTSYVLKPLTYVGVTALTPVSTSANIEKPGDRIKDIRKYYTLSPSNATNNKVECVSSDTSVVTVDCGIGTATAQDWGAADITITSKDSPNLSMVLHVTVSTPVKSVSLSPASASLSVGGVAQLEAAVLPADATDKSITFSSSDQAIATVSQTGLVTAKALGEATITATSTNGITAQSVITVEDKKVTSIDVTPSMLNITINTPNPKFSATVLPADAFDKSLTWTISCPQYASIDNTGQVTVLKNESSGVCKVLAKANDGSGVQDPASLAVSVGVESISLSPSSVTLLPGADQQLSAAFIPSNPSIQGITYTSSNQAVATVSQTGLVIAISSGTATITATTQDGGFTASSVVNVHIPVSQVVLSLNSPVNLNVGQTANLTAQVLPTDATNKKVIFSSSDPSVATVSQEGLITALKSGHSGIVVTSDDN